MSREFKIALIVALVSVLLPFLAIKSKPPAFLSSVEQQIASFQVQEIKLTERKSFSYELKLPFYLAAKKEQIKESAKTLPALKLSLIYRGRSKYALVGDRIVREGQMIDGYVVKYISKDSVLIKDKKGEKRWLKLEPYY